MNPTFQTDPMSDTDVAVEMDQIHHGSHEEASDDNHRHFTQVTDDDAIVLKQ